MVGIILTVDNLGEVFNASAVRSHSFYFLGMTKTLKLKLLRICVLLKVALLMIIQR